MFHRIKTAANAGRPLVMIMPNPWPAYSRLAELINRFRVNCRRLYTLQHGRNTPNEHGEIAPETWEYGFLHSFKKHFWARIDPGCGRRRSRCRAPRTATSPATAR